MPRIAVLLLVLIVAATGVGIAFAASAITPSSAPQRTSSSVPVTADAQADRDATGAAFSRLRSQNVAAAQLEGVPDGLQLDVAQAAANPEQQTVARWEGSVAAAALAAEGTPITSVSIRDTAVDGQELSSRPLFGADLPPTKIDDGALEAQVRQAVNESGVSLDAIEIDRPDAPVVRLAVTVGDVVAFLTAAQTANGNPLTNALTRLTYDSDGSLRGSLLEVRDGNGEAAAVVGITRFKYQDTNGTGWTRPDIQAKLPPPPSLAPRAPGLAGTP